MSYDAARIRAMEAISIHSFVQSVEWYGRVLDYGCGRKPYEKIVTSTCTSYVPFDRSFLPGSVLNPGEAYGPTFVLGPAEYDMILCTQVIQYVPEPPGLLDAFRGALAENGRLVMTYPTNWDEVEPDDLYRFTKAGMEFMLTEVGFKVERHEQRAVVQLADFRFPLGHGVVACRS